MIILVPTFFSKHFLFLAIYEAIRAAIFPTSIGPSSYMPDEINISVKKRLWRVSIKNKKAPNVSVRVSSRMDRSSTFHSLDTKQLVFNRRSARSITLLIAIPLLFSDLDGGYASKRSYTLFTRIIWRDDSSNDGNF
jgi:hypothetical protein